MFWFDKQNDQVLFMDNRKHYEKLESGHIVAVNLTLLQILERCRLMIIHSIMLYLILRIY